MRVGQDALTTLSVEVLNRVSMLLLSVVVARLLAPIDVGTLGLAVVIVGLISMLAFFPENAAVIVRVVGGDHEHALAGCLTRIGVTAVLTLIVVFGLDVIAAVLGGDAIGAGKLHRLTALLLWQPWLEGAASYPRVLLRRRLDLGYVARMHLIGNLLFVGTTVVLLGWGVGGASVVWGQLLGSATVAGLAWQRVAWKGALSPWGWPLPETWSALARESARLFTGGVGGYMSERLDNLLVAGSLGPTSAGFYAVAWNVARTPVNALSQVVYSVVIPVIAADRDHKDRVTQTLRYTVRFSYLLLSFGAAVFFFLGPVLVEGILGAKWRPLGPALRVMAFTILNAPIQFAASAFLMTTGRAHIIGLATSAHIAVEFLLIPPFARAWGVLGAGYADLVGTTLVTVACCAGVWLSAGPPRWLDFRAAFGTTLAALLATGSAVAIVPAAQTSAPAAVLALAASLVFFPILTAALGGLGSLKELAAAARGWRRGVRAGE